MGGLQDGRNFGLEDTAMVWKSKREIQLEWYGVDATADFVVEFRAIRKDVCRARNIKVAL